MASLVLIIISTLLATLGHCVRGHKMLLASGLYALGGKKLRKPFTYSFSGKLTYKNPYCHAVVDFFIDNIFSGKAFFATILIH